MRVYGYPRSGNHVLMYALHHSFVLTCQEGDYRQFSGGHFATDACGKQRGYPPQAANDALAIVRDPSATAGSIWRMRAWFGLTRPNSFESFLERPYCESFENTRNVSITVNFGYAAGIAFGGDDCFRGVDLKPFEHHRAYYAALAPLCRIVVAYEELLSDPETSLRRIADEFDIGFIRPTLPTTRIGFSPEPL